MIAIPLALLLSQVTAVEHAPDLGGPLSGTDYLLIAEAARHREMLGADLSCFEIFVYDDKGVSRVDFIEARNRTVERQTQDGGEIIYSPPDPNCRSISFIMGRDGRVAEVIKSDH